jgi:type I restriction enzyme S subunit
MCRPPLRFKQFNDNWTPMTVGDLGIFKKGGGVSADITTKTGLPAMMYGDIYVKYDTFFDKVDWYIQINQAKTSTKVSKNVLLFTCSGETAIDIGKCVCYLGDEDIYIGGDILSLTPNKETNGLFVAMAMNRHDLIKQRARLGQGHSVVHIYQPHIESLRINMPSLPEQTRVATFLNLLYKKIKLQQEKMELLERELQSETERIFQSIKGTATRIEEIIKQVSIRNRNCKDYPVLSVNNKLGFILQGDQFEEGEVASQDKSNYKIVSQNIFAYNPARINVGSIALLETFKHGIVSPMYICFECSKNLIPVYFEYYLHTQEFKREMTKRLEGSVRQCLTFESICNIPFILPEMKIQEKASKYLNCLLMKINLEKTKFEQLQLLKKGLLQQLFC